MASEQVETVRVPYRAAVAVFVVVLVCYVWTLAPTVTFWDAGEFIATAKILGIPHPPGTPLFVLMSNVWAALVPIGEFAYRTNLMTAVFSAAAAALFFLVVAQALRGWKRDDEGQDSAGTDKLFTIGGGVAAALLAATAFTVWQNSNETELYMIAASSIAAICWLGWLWRRHRGGERAPHVLLLIVYLGALSVGNHLLTLLVGPALIGFMWHVLKTEPLAEEADRKTEWAQWAVVLGVWALLLGVGLGSTGLLVLGGLAFLGAAAYAASAGALPFAATVLMIAVVGASTYLFLLIRAQVGPFINEADPSTWERLLAVIAREQYPPRSPIDNPIYTVREGSGMVERIGAFVACLPRFVDGPVPPDEAVFGIPRCHTVRSIPLMLRQAQMYLQYFDWQWSMGLAPTDYVCAAVRLPITPVFISLGVYGANVLRQRDRSVFWLLVLLFLTTGPALVGYMNFKPGFSLAWDTYPQMDMHEVRERDYFFTVSFAVWGIFVGLGLAGLYRKARELLGARDGGRRELQLASAAVLLAALLPFVLNFRAASRAHGPEARLARDFAYDLLQSVEPYGIVYTNGDNDTFPLWYLQEVEEIRQDVSVVNLSLANTNWYIRQLRDNPVRPFDPEQAPWFADLAPATPPSVLHSLADPEVEQLMATLLSRALIFRAGEMELTIPENTPLYVHSMIVLRLIQENWAQRPIYFSLTSGGDNWGLLAPYLTQEALVFRLNTAGWPDTANLVPGLFGVPVNVSRTDSLAWEIYRYADLFRGDTLRLDPTNRNITVNLSYPFYTLGQAYESRGDLERSRENLRRGLWLQPIPEIARLLETGESIFDTPAAGDTPVGQ